ncbi:enoyl-CoA hydratase/isomerase family protein [uncultured Tateyamaria sp.]|uniref:enoyl-CoA hydratase/isomerase family protein n=1 Tax=uncultured Tateyamaria sp. TaxID=455651 RepID=UPI002611CE08|nr:enoyl-CoA hydratase/isomerase family protein [uncultured Tateyamaria sp.]
MSHEIADEVRDGVLWITFNRPEARNALTFAMYDRLAELCTTMPTDGSIRAVVISGAGGKAFAAGTDMTQFRAFETPQDALDYEHRIDEVLEAVERCPLPTIAALNGACTGGGGSIASACDIRVASASLKFGFPIARTLGNCLAAGNLARLSELIGAGRVREIIFTARLIEAQEALDTGLVSEVLPDETALMARASELADKIGGMAPLTLRATKEALRRNRAALQVDDSDLIVSCYMSDDFRTGMEAFLAKTKPEWKGK